VIDTAKQPAYDPFEKSTYMKKK